MFFFSVTYNVAISNEISILLNIFGNRLEHPYIFINHARYEECKSRTSKINIIKCLNKYAHEKTYSFVMFVNDQGISVIFS